MEGRGLLIDTLCFNLQPEQEPKGIKENKDDPCTWVLWEQLKPVPGGAHPSGMRGCDWEHWVSCRGCGGVCVSSDPAPEPRGGCLSALLSNVCPHIKALLPSYSGKQGKRISLCMLSILSCFQCLIDSFFFFLGESLRGWFVLSGNENQFTRVLSQRWFIFTPQCSRARDGAGTKLLLWERFCSAL